MKIATHTINSTAQEPKSALRGRMQQRARPAHFASMPRTGLKKGGRILEVAFPSPPIALTPFSACP